MHAGIGSISHGTLNPEHLIPVFADELEALAKRDRDSRRRTSARDAVAEARAPWTRDTDELLEALSNQLEGYAPPYAYFGSHEGDGSDFGFWPALGSLEEDARFDRDGAGVIKLEAGEPWPPGLRKDGIRFVMEVNDHGNVALRYASNGREVWAVV